MRYRVEAGGAAVAVVDGRIADAAATRCALTIAVSDGVLLPGLINAHDHLHRNHYPRLGRPPYTDAYAWGRDIHAHDAAAIASARAVPRRTALLFGAFRNLIAGVTTAVHHDRWEPAFDDGFPLRVPPIRHAHSIGFDAETVRLLARSTDRSPFTIHVAEGTTADAAAEVQQLAALGLVRRELLAVHVVAADRKGVRRLRAAGAAVVWCPSANHFLFGRTCSADTLHGVDVLLGTDALLTGEGTLLDELRFARGLGVIADVRLAESVGALAAKRIGVAGGTLEAGKAADLVILRAPLLAASAADVALVVVGGVPRVADEQLGELFAAAGIAARLITVGGVRKLVSQPLFEAADYVLSRWPECGRILSAQHAAATAQSL